MHPTRKTGAFTLAEMMFAIAILALLVLMTVAAMTSVIKSNQKASLLGGAEPILDGIFQETIYQVDNDVPPGTRDSRHCCQLATGHPEGRQYRVYLRHLC